MKEFTYQERHMGTDVSLALICEEEMKAKNWAEELFVTINEYELRFSRFLLNSELTKLNQEGSLRVSDEFIAVLLRSIELSKLTKQIFNPLIQVARLGYTRSFTSLIDINSTNATKYNTDIDAVTVNQTTNRVTLASGQALDFGGILKGYLANKLADLTMQKHPEFGGVIINIGGDIATRGHDEFHKPFTFMLYDPVRDQDIPINLVDKSLATSGTYARTWQTANGKKHHIVNSQTGDNPDSEVVAVSVVHEDGAMTEAITKLFLVQGSETATNLLPPEQYDYQYLCVHTDGLIAHNFNNLQPIS